MCFCSEIIILNGVRKAMRFSAQLGDKLPASNTWKELSLKKGILDRILYEIANSGMSRQLLLPILSSLS
jgi:hypothetical protein